MGPGTIGARWKSRAITGACALAVVAGAALGGAIAATGMSRPASPAAIHAVEQAKAAGARLDGVTSAQTAYGMLASFVTYVLAVDGFGADPPQELLRYAPGASATRDSLTRDQIVDTIAALNPELESLGEDLSAGLVDLDAAAWGAFESLSTDDLAAARAGTLEIAAAPYLAALFDLERAVRSSDGQAEAARRDLAEAQAPRGRPTSVARLVLGGGLVLAALAFALGALAVNRRHRQLRRQADSDALTGVANRRRLDRDLLARPDDSVGVLMIDLDHFKQLNDSAGHRAGDDALRRVARAIRACLRDGDVLYRYGGEEFCVLLPNASAHDCVTIAERIRSAVEAIVVPGEDRLPLGRQTVSIGVACGPDAPTRVADADRALYEAKRQGRNRTVEASTRVE